MVETKIITRMIQINITKTGNVVEASHMVRTALLMETLEAARVAAQIAVKEILKLMDLESPYDLHLVCY